MTTFLTTDPVSLVSVPATPAAPATGDTPRALDWSHVSSVGPVRSCRICRRGAMMRDPAGHPCHKVCAEQHEYEYWQTRVDVRRYHRTHRLAA